MRAIGPATSDSIMNKNVKRMRSTLIALSLLAATAAEAGPGIILQGVQLNGPGIILQGVHLNGPGVVLQGIVFNGPGVVLQGKQFNGPDQATAAQSWSPYANITAPIDLKDCRAPAALGHSLLSGLVQAHVNVQLRTN